MMKKLERVSFKIVYISETECPGFSWNRANFHKKLAGLTQQPIQWDILYYVMSCSVFKWGAG